MQRTSESDISRMDDGTLAGSAAYYRARGDIRQIRHDSWHYETITRDMLPPDTWDKLLDNGILDLAAARLRTKNDHAYFIDSDDRMTYAQGNTVHVVTATKEEYRVGAQRVVIADISGEGVIEIAGSPRFVDSTDTNRMRHAVAWLLE